MIEALFVTVLPIGFLTVLFGGGELLRRRTVFGEPYAEYCGRVRRYF